MTNIWPAFSWLCVGVQICFLANCQQTAGGSSSDFQVGFSYPGKHLISNNHLENGNRYKRELKPAHSFLEVKRLRDFVGKRNTDDETAIPSVLDYKQSDSLDNSKLTENSPNEVPNDDHNVLHSFHFEDSLYPEKNVIGPYLQEASPLAYIPRQSLGYPNFGLWKTYDKRLRDFVGKRDSAFRTDKRLRDFVGKRVRDFVGKREAGIIYEDGIDNQKRLRDFVGKRAREFVGKRSLGQYDPVVSKRLRDFVGKRNSVQDDRDGQWGDLNEDPNLLELENVGKRLRDFVGKRFELDSSPDKRLRDFVGKRFELDSSPDKRLRDFVGKRFDLNSTPDLSYVDKRLRDFVGKRSGEEDAINEGKRLRDFVGKRNARQVDELLNWDSKVEASENGEMSKRLRDFVGKRSYDHLAGSAYRNKRLRDFVGRRR